MRVGGVRVTSIAVSLLLFAPGSVRAQGLEANGEPWHCEHFVGSGGSCSELFTAGATGDFNGDGYADAALGDPGDASGSGRVRVLYGDSGGIDVANFRDLYQSWVGVADTSEAGDRFGASLAAGDFDGDGYGDLAVGAPNEDLGGVVDTGLVHIFYGSSTGFNVNDPVASGAAFHQNTSGILGTNETGDRYGASLAAGDFDGDGYDDLAIGVPGQDLTGATQAGMIAVLYGTASGITAAGDALLAQDFASVVDSQETGDAFGEALVSADFDADGFDDVAVGIPFEDIGGTVDAGAIQVFYGEGTGLGTNGNQFLHQNVPGILGTAIANDHFGSALAVGRFDANAYDDLVIGIPGKTLDGNANAGSIHVLYGSSTGITDVGDQHLGIDLTGNATAADDEFGFSVAAGDFDADGDDDVAVGVPGRNCSSAPATCTTASFENAGQVWLYQGGSGLIFDSVRGLGDISGLYLVRSQDAFGTGLASGDVNGDGKDDLVVGAPDAGLIPPFGANGVFAVFYGERNPPPAQTASIDVVWIATTGAGVPGTNDIYAENGDELTAEIRVTTDRRGAYSMIASLLFDTDLDDELELISADVSCSFFSPCDEYMTAIDPLSTQESTLAQEGRVAGYNAGVWEFNQNPRPGPATFVIGTATFLVNNVSNDGDDVFAGFFFADEVRGDEADHWLDEQTVDVADTILLGNARVRASVNVPVPSLSGWAIGLVILALSIGGGYNLRRR